ncbi:MAG: hypothetical protein H0V70_04130 [Ktedonobacteraceae bacterium]|nr:hypothetical protein [Ktedonobacteraceae bacterium]
MTLLAAIVALFFVVLVVCGIYVNVYMYSNGAFNERMRRGKKQRLGAVSLGQVDSIPTAASAARLYPKRTHMSTHTRVFLLYSLGILLSLIVLVALVLGATQF